MKRLPYDNVSQGSQKGPDVKFLSDTLRIQHDFLAKSHIERGIRETLVGVHIENADKAACDDREKLPSQERKIQNERVPLLTVHHPL